MFDDLSTVVCLSLLVLLLFLARKFARRKGATGPSSSFRIGQEEFPPEEVEIMARAAEVGQQAGLVGEALKQFILRTLELFRELKSK